ncbi:hypothetical protein HYALB_00007579 [Hymenoscyphus albidus]|uniref:Uncharacterized protein n=1 Tax=Hymenoscyphus albidus TaxID=595503 RepID=A0A9N9LIC9_9HELO|nr:hypothetical protein HYALB_00007579 [Hymenoscyphus albidus]
MAEQLGTPGSNADNSINGGKGGAPKDKACPFCHQKFTSSSLGRHLDLYIKEKNPKPSDGVHDVDEIRKMRGGITRRQPRNSASRREDSTPAGTPSNHDRRSPGGPDSGGCSPNLRRNDDERGMQSRKTAWKINSAGWETTGVMNVIPNLRNGDSVRSWDSEDRDGARKLDNRGRSVSKQMLAKTTFEQKQKMMDALDNAQAAKLALREILGSVRAAKRQIDDLQVFDYDPLTLDFPSIVLRCLPPPPTLYQAMPIASSASWSIQPPDDQQYQALREHFANEFNRFRVSCQVATTVAHDDLSYPPPHPDFDDLLDDPAEIARRAENEASELESRVSEHLHAVFAHWSSLSHPKRQEIWILEMARALGRQSEEIQKLKKEKEYAQQETAHLKIQVDELSRLQHPREFKLVSPSTMPIDSDTISRLGEIGMTRKYVGHDMSSVNLHLDTAIDRAIGKWKIVVKEARGSGNGLLAQRSLSGESAPQTSVQLPPQNLAPVRTPITPNPPQLQNHISHQHTSSNISNMSNHNDHISHQHTSSNISNHNVSMSNSSNNLPVQVQVTDLTSQSNDDMGSDADADADADMDDDDSYMEMNDLPQQTRAPEAPMAQPSNNFRLPNGNVQPNSLQQNNNGRGLEGMENQVVQGYVRIGA